METHHFWAFFVIALIAGGAIALAINGAMTGYITWPWGGRKPSEPKPLPEPIPGPLSEPQPTLLQRFFGTQPAVKEAISVEITEPMDGSTVVEEYVDYHQPIRLIATSTSALTGVTLKMCKEKECLEFTDALLCYEKEKTLDCVFSWWVDDTPEGWNYVKIEATATDTKGQKAIDTIYVYVKKLVEPQLADCSNCQNVLSMLNNCKVAWARNMTINCDTYCKYDGEKTCIGAFSFDGKITMPYECSWEIKPPYSLACICCSPPLTPYLKYASDELYKYADDYMKRMYGSWENAPEEVFYFYRKSTGGSLVPGKISLISSERYLPYDIGEVPSTIRKKLKEEENCDTMLVTIVKMGRDIIKLYHYEAGEWHFTGWDYPIP